MKKILLISALVCFSLAIHAQVQTNRQTQPTIPNSNAMFDGSTAFSAEAMAPNNIGKGIVMPSVDLINFEFTDIANGIADGTYFPSYFDGMIVYNRSTGTTLTAGNRSSTATAVTPGFYYFSNPTGKTTQSVTSGVWKPLGGGGGTASPWNVVGGTTQANGNTQNIYQAGKVGIGASYNTGSITSTLEVDGAATNKTSFSAGTDVAIDFTKSNLAYSTSTNTAPAFNCSGMKDGGTYTLAWQGAIAGTGTITSSGMTIKMVNNVAKTDTQHAVYTIVCIGTTAYVYVTLF